jgi:hypothetical protein
MGLISAYIDGELTGEEKSGFEAHLKNCPDCNEQYLGILEIVNILNIEEEVELPENFHINFMDKLNKEKNKNPVFQKFETLFGFFNPLLFRKQVFAFSGAFAAIMIFFLSLSALMEPAQMNMPAAESGGLIDNSGILMDTVDDSIKSRVAFEDDYILNYNITLITGNINETVNRISQTEGLTVFSEIYSGSWGAITREIDKNNVDRIFDTLSDLGEMSNYSESRQSIAFSKIDIEARIKAKNDELERLYGLLSQAPNAEYLYKVYDRIAELENESATLYATSRDYDASSNTSTINITIEQKSTPVLVEKGDILSKCKGAFLDSLNFLIHLLGRVFITLINISVPIFIILLIIFTLKHFFRKGMRP